MQTRGWLLVDIVETQDEYTKVQSELIDGSKFVIAVRKSTLSEIESKNLPKRAWLEVEYYGQRSNQVSITLPQPILNHGKKVVVDSSKISLNIR